MQKLILTALIAIAAHAQVLAPTSSTAQTESFTFRVPASFSILNVIIASTDLNVDACYFLYNASGATGRGTIALFADFPEANNYNPWASGWVDGTDLSNS